jgi:hypothetical protein
MMVKYLGTGNEWIYGIPTRDLTDDEWKALPAALQYDGVASGLYEVKADKPPKEKVEAE